MKYYSKRNSSENKNEEIKVDLFEAINSRRSIRRYTADPVDDQKINTILEAGRWAPSWANTQCTRFVVVRDPGIKAALAETINKMKTPDGERSTYAGR